MPFWGIMADLGRGWHSVTVRVSALDGRGQSSLRGSPDEVTNYVSLGCWWSINQPKSGIIFDFHGKTVQLTGYSLKSGDRYHLLHWALDGSFSPRNSQRKWHRIDERFTHDLNGNWVSKTYPTWSRPVRLLRIRQIGKNSEGNDIMCLSAVEFFGTLSG